jgi:Gpi18-like mannosyltransferase
VTGSSNWAEIVSCIGQAGGWIPGGHAERAVYVIVTADTQQGWMPLPLICLMMHRLEENTPVNDERKHRVSINEQPRVRLQLWQSLSWQQWILLAIAIIAVLIMHKTLVSYYTEDFTVFVTHWFDHLKNNGFGGLADNFSNYNVPYLYLLYLGTLTPFDGLQVTKIIAGFFDLVLAAGAAAVVFRIRPSIALASVVAVATLFIPEVFLNSGFWGQSDSIYAAFILWAIFFLLKQRDILAWVFFAVAFQVKLQAVFFLPLMGIAFIVQKHRWRAVGYGVLTCLAIFIPAMIAGRSIPSLLGIYYEQAQGSPITVNAANIYQWVPSTVETGFQTASIFFAVGLVALLSIVYLHRAARATLAPSWLLQVAAAYGVLIPFVLPQIHDRYFYVGGILVLLCAIIDRRYLIPGLLLQFTAIMAYSPQLYHEQPVVPFWALAIVQLVSVSWVVWASVAPTGKPISAATITPTGIPKGSWV